MPQLFVALYYKQHCQNGKGNNGVVFNLPHTKALHAFAVADQQSPRDTDRRHRPDHCGFFLSLVAKAVGDHRWIGKAVSFTQ